MSLRDVTDDAPLSLTVPNVTLTAQTTKRPNDSNHHQQQQ
jgi:hypothetical protein